MFEINCKNWAEFKTSYRSALSIGGKSYSKENFLFRGQMDSDWHITSSFDRIENNKSKSHELLARFKVALSTNYHPIMDDPNINDDIITSFGQHHGLPTRLIDWSDSPYIGAFFAFSDVMLNNFKGKYTSIWVINKKSEAIEKESGGIRFIEIPNNKVNQRIKNQRGQFTLSNYLEDYLEDYVRNICLKHGHDDALWKFNLPTSEAKEAIDDLDLMDINYESIYPDTEGFVKSTIINVLR